MTGPAVLVVEDMPQTRATAVQLFEELGCAVFDAYNGHGALKILEARPEIQVLFADVRMPGMSGPELAEAAQRLRPDLRIVLTSGYVSRTEVPATIPFVPKPWSVRDIGGRDKILPSKLGVTRVASRVRPPRFTTG